ncbi:MAG: hypothetical protein PHI16_01505 [Methanocellales archaeon]|nr:hypothetical protein [Methanocellales archaeon]
MADYTAPFHAPHLSTAEFEETRRKYVEKYGYSVTVPAIDDVIHLKGFKPLTEEENELWKQRKYDLIPDDRRAEIQAEKERKKKQFLAMLADPSPKIVRDAAAILTSLDDLQDAVSTIACLGLIAGAIIGGPIAAAIAGPLGIVLGASTVLNLINPYSHLRNVLGPKSAGRAAKRKAEKLTDQNPFTKKGRVKISKVIKKFKPTVGNAIEAAQTTDQIYGVGLSIGPIMGFVQSSIAGVIRTAKGEKVDWDVSSWKPTKQSMTAAKAMNAVNVFNGLQWQSDQSDETLAIYAALISMQVLYSDLQEFNPLAEIENVGDYLLECPQPTNALTLEIFAELGIDPENACNWPQNGQKYISFNDLQEFNQNQATANLRHYGEQNNHDPDAFNALTAADDFAFLFLDAMEGTDQVKVDWTITEKIVFTILNNNWSYPDNITPGQVDKFEEWVQLHDYMGTQPNSTDIQNFAEIFCGFSFVVIPFDY